MSKVVGSKSLVGAEWAGRRPSLLGDRFGGLEDIEPRVFECVVKGDPFLWFVLEEAVDKIFGLFGNRL